MRIFSSDNVADVIGSLNLPNLRALEVDTQVESSGQMIVDAIEDLVLRSKCDRKLQHLSLRNVHLSSTTLVSPSLRTFSITSSSGYNVLGPFVSEDVIEALTERCTSLTAVKFAFTPENGNITRVRELIESRGGKLDTSLVCVSHGYISLKSEEKKEYRSLGVMFVILHGGGW